MMGSQKRMVVYLGLIISITLVISTEAIEEYISQHRDPSEYEQLVLIHNKADSQRRIRRSGGFTRTYNKYVTMDSWPSRSSHLSPSKLGGSATASSSKRTPIRSVSKRRLQDSTTRANPEYPPRIGEIGPVSSNSAHQKLLRPEKCVPIEIPMCKEIGYNLTYMPNAFNHETQDEAGLEVSFGF